jgi:hypothetical protein
LRRLTDFDEERVYPSDKENFKLVQYTTSKGLVVTEEVTNAGLQRKLLK